MSPHHSLWAKDVLHVNTIKFSASPGINIINDKLLNKRRLLGLYIIKTTHLMSVNLLRVIFYIHQPQKKTINKKDNEFIICKNLYSK